MKTWLALLRGVNVGGNNKLPMKPFAAELASAGLLQVKTYIQSGNVVFQSADESVQANDLAQQISILIKDKFGFETPVMVLRLDELNKAIKNNPYVEAANQALGNTLHFVFLKEQPAAIDETRLNAVQRPSERWALIGKVFYLHTPEGFGTSKLAAQVDRALGVTNTARNWRTIEALLALALPIS